MINKSTFSHGSTKILAISLLAVILSVIAFGHIDNTLAAPDAGSGKAGKVIISINPPKDPQNIAYRGPRRLQTVSGTVSAVNVAGNSIIVSRPAPVAPKNGKKSAISSSALLSATSTLSPDFYHFFFSTFLA